MFQFGFARRQNLLAKATHPDATPPGFALEGLEVRRMFTVPPTPINQSETAMTQTTITLSWPGSSTAEDGFQIQRKINGTYVAIANTAPTVTTYTDTGLTPASSYDYRILAFQGMDISGFAFVNGAVTSGTGTGTGPETPYPSTAATIPGTVQAENFDNGGEGVAYHTSNPKNYTGNLYRASGVTLEYTGDTGGYDVGFLRTGDYLKYTVNVATTTNYDFSARVTNAAPGGSFHVLVDGNNVTGTLAIPNTGGYQTYQTVTKSAIPLTAGQHVVELVMDSANAYGFAGNFNSFAFTQTAVGGSPSTPFGGTAAALPGEVQAENFDEGGQGVAYNTSNTKNYTGNLYRASGVTVETTADTGGGYQLGFLHTGDYFNYTVNVTTAGTYTFDARVSNAAPGGSLHAEVDGVNVTGTLVIPNTGSYNAFTDVTKSGISLSAGKHVVRLVLDSQNSYGYSGNINWFQFT